MSKRKKRKGPSKKVRAWYSVYREQKEAIGEDPYPLKIWAAFEAERLEGTAKGKELARFVGVRR